MQMMCKWTTTPEGIACRQYILGMQDVFDRSGKPKDLLDCYGLDAKHIAEKIKEIFYKIAWFNVVFTWTLYN